MANLRSGRAAVLALSIGWPAFQGCQDSQPVRARSAAGGLQVSSLLGQGEDSADFERAIAPRAFRFPEDHGPHPSFRNEWWYFTGNLDAPGERHFGYQLTVFRTALAPADGGALRSSRWASSQVYMGNFALTDVDSGQFHASDRFERQALELAGATASPFHVWIDDWMVRSIGAETFPVRLHARHRQISIDLVLDQGMAPVLEGARGLSQKGSEVGQASYYYSLPRMPTSGAIEIGGRAYRAEGTSWMDREWSTSSLGKEQVGWDWFALQFSEGSSLMYYQLRGPTGEPGPFSAGTWIDKEGRTNSLSREDVGLQISSWWASPIDQRRYPGGWRLRISRVGLDVEVTPFLPNQELNLAVRYWEGAVRVSGRSAAGRIAGVGYVELTGY